MNTGPQGPGWWQASDGNWYAPEQHPDPEHRRRHAAPPTPPTPPTPPLPTPPTPPGAAAGPPPAMPPTTATQTPGAADPNATVVFGSPPLSPSPAAFPQADAGHGFATPPGHAPGSAPMPATAMSGYPATLTVDRSPVIARWRLFVTFFMLIPHVIALWVIGLISSIVSVVSWFAILFTGTLPRGLHDFQAMTIRYANRVAGLALFLTEEYPPFEFTASAGDPTSHPVRTDVAYREEHNRLTTFFRYPMLVPHMFALFFVMIGAYLAMFVAWWAILFTGRMPDGIGNYLIGVGRWITRLGAYARLLTDEYPPFSLS